MNRSKTALVLLDLQTEFLDDRGRMPISRDQVGGLVACVNRLVRGAQGQAEILYVGNEFSRWDYPANWFRRHAAVQGSPGCRLDPRIAVVGDRYFAKRRASVFTNRAFARFLDDRGIRSLGLCGVFASFCVLGSCRAALSRGYQVTVIRDGVADRSDPARDAAIARMEAEGATALTADEFLRILSEAT